MFILLNIVLIPTSHLFLYTSLFRSRFGSSFYLADHYGSLLEKGKQIWCTCLDDCWGCIICAFRPVLSRTAWHALCCITNGVGILCICYGKFGNAEEDDIRYTCRLHAGIKKIQALQVACIFFLYKSLF